MIFNIMLSSLDGCIGSFVGESTGQRRKSGFTHEADFQWMRQNVSSCDAVFIGARSLMAERGAFRTADLRLDSEEPWWFLFSASGNLDLSHPFWTQPGFRRGVVFCTSFSLEEDPVVHVEKKPLLGQGEPITWLVGNLSGILAQMEEWGIGKVALLGGGELNSLFWQAGAVDRMFLSLSPWLVGSVGAPRLVSGAVLHALHLEKVRSEGDFLFLEYARVGGR